MTKKKYRRYSPEFKRHALKRASEDGVTDQIVTRSTLVERHIECFQGLELRAAGRVLNY